MRPLITLSVSLSTVLVLLQYASARRPIVRNAAA
jgi:hypothetical protein